MTEALGRKAQSRERIVKAASHAIRRVGFEGVGVVDIMKEAGLTHGGFYSHFKSREELLAVAVTRAGADLRAALAVHMDQLVASGVSPFRALVETYLHDSQISDAENGCPVGGLCAEMSRQGEEVVEASRCAVNHLHKAVQRALGPIADSAVCWSITGTLVGAIQLARTLGDNQAGQEVMAAARADLISRFGG
jgi:TetR/AcrR family transcriptional repressor of nem operon